MLHIHLPLFAQLCRCIVVSRMPGLFLCGFHFLPAAEPDEHAAQWPRVPAAGFLLAELAVQFADTDVGAEAMVVPYPAQFLFCVRVGMLAVGTV